MNATIHQIYNLRGTVSKSAFPETKRQIKNGGGRLLQLKISSVGGAGGFWIMFFETVAAPVNGSGGDFPPIYVPQNGFAEIRDLTFGAGLWAASSTSPDEYAEGGLFYFYAETK